MRVGVVCLNLGGPASLSEVKPFLYNLFSDPDIIPVPFSKILRKPIAKLIAAARHRMSSGYYRAIGGGSPLQKITRDQADALESLLNEKLDFVKVYVAMRYWHPSTEAAWEEIKRDAITHLIVLPLYPQYSIATTGSSYRVLKQLMSKGDSSIRHIAWIDQWYDHPLYIEAFASHIRQGVSSLPAAYRDNFHLIFSAHGLPMKIIKAGDPYNDQIQKTIKLLLEKIGPVASWHLSYQSRTGPIKWLKPSTSNLMKGLAKQKKRALLMVPISFVSDHVETLYEIDILYKKEALALGFPHFQRVESLNLSPLFIEALGDLVVNRL